MMEKFASWLDRNRYLVFGIWLVHLVLMHYFFLGFVSWDGFGYRGTGVIELVQHGGIDAVKFNDWSFAGYVPFVELVQVPFLKLFGMTGFLLGFPLVVLPFCAWSIRALIAELVGDPKFGTIGAFVYVAIPMINAQPFSGYIDFAISGLLAFWLFAFLRIRHADATRWADVRLGLATLLFTMARVQTIYVAIVLVPFVAYAAFGKPTRRLFGALGVMAIGAGPMIALQIDKFLVYGSPTYPVRFLGGGGWPREIYFKYAGLAGDDWGSVLKGAFDGWIWHAGPYAFYASQYLAAGALAVVAIVLLPLALPRLGRLELGVLAGFVVTTLITRDFGIPRYSYTLVVALVVLVVRGLAALSSRSTWWRTVAMWGVVAIVAAHLLRPEYDYVMLRDATAPHMNVSGSRHYRHGASDVPIYPDIHARFLIVDHAPNNFITQIYGRDLENEVVGIIAGAEIGPHCEKLRGQLFIDDGDVTKACPRVCAIEAARARTPCLAFRLTGM